MGFFNDPAWKIVGGGGVGGGLTPTTYIKLTGAGSTARWGWIKKIGYNDIYGDVATQKAAVSLFKLQLEKREKNVKSRSLNPTRKLDPSTS